MFGLHLSDLAKLWYIKLTPSLKKLAEAIRSSLHNPPSFFADVCDLFYTRSGEAIGAYFISEVNCGTYKKSREE